MSLRSKREAGTAEQAIPHSMPRPSGSLGEWILHGWKNLLPYLGQEV